MPTLIAFYTLWNFLPSFRPHALSVFIAVIVLGILQAAASLYGNYASLGPARPRRVVFVFVALAALVCIGTIWVGYANDKSQYDSATDLKANNEALRSGIQALSRDNGGLRDGIGRLQGQAEALLSKADQLSNASPAQIAEIRRRAEVLSKEIEKLRASTSAAPQTASVTPAASSNFSRPPFTPGTPTGFQAPTPETSAQAAVRELTDLESRLEQIDRSTQTTIQSRLSGVRAMYVHGAKRDDPKALAAYPKGDVQRILNDRMQQYELVIQQLKALRSRIDQSSAIKPSERAEDQRAFEQAYQIDTAEVKIGNSWWESGAAYGVSFQGMKSYIYSLRRKIKY